MLKYLMGLIPRALEYILSRKPLRLWFGGGMDAGLSEPPASLGRDRFKADKIYSESPDSRHKADFLADSPGSECQSRRLGVEIQPSIVEQINRAGVQYCGNVRLTAGDLSYIDACSDAWDSGAPIPPREAFPGG
jgi:hypothetical protein